MTCQKCKSDYGIPVKLVDDPTQYVYCNECSRDEVRKRIDKKAPTPPAVRPEPANISEMDHLSYVGIFTGKDKPNAPQSST